MISFLGGFNRVMDYIWQIGVGLAVLAIAGICKWFFSRNKPKSHSQKTIIKGDGNTVNNIIEDTKE